jgi:hypothetical protein
MMMAVQVCSHHRFATLQLGNDETPLSTCISAVAGYAEELVPRIVVRELSNERTAKIRGWLTDLVRRAP